MIKSLHAFLKLVSTEDLTDRKKGEKVVEEREKSMK